MILSDLPPGVNPLDPHIVGYPELGVALDEATRTWEAEGREGYYWFFKGTWFAQDSNDMGEPHAPEGRGTTPEAAVEDLLDQISEAWPED